MKDSPDQELIAMQRIISLTKPIRAMFAFCAQQQRSCYCRKVDIRTEMITMYRDLNLNQPCWTPSAIIYLRPDSTPIPCYIIYTATIVLL